MFLRLFIAFLGLPLAGSALAASSVQAITPHSMSVAGGETKTVAARFFDALDHPAAGESVRFSVNDSCGRFPSGPSQVVTTDLTGLASADFTASNPPGIVCFVSASAGVTINWQVLTYPISQVHFDATTDPAPRRPGPFTLVVKAFVGAYELRNVDVTARVVPGSITASISPTGTVDTGDDARAEFTVVPDDQLGDFAIEIEHLGKVQRVPFNPPAQPWQDMWWGGASENGWGVSVVQHEDKLFSVIYAYDTAGKPTWYVIPAGMWNEAKTAFAGDVYVTRGSPYSSYDVSKLVVGAPVGTATFSFTSLANVSLDYTIDGVTGHKSLSRQQFGPPDTPIPQSVADMWWGGAAQNGWGIAMLQQYRSLFNVWFTYDDAGAPIWFVMPLGSWIDANTYVGLIYRTNGSAWLGQSYNASLLQSTQAGSFRMHFDTGTFEYTIDGRSGSMALTRQPF